jgi:hypothetical protein
VSCDPGPNDRERSRTGTVTRTVAVMGVLGELFPGRKIQDEAGEAGEAGDGQKWRLGPIDLENGVVEVHRSAAEPETVEDDEG